MNTVRISLEDISLLSFSMDLILALLIKLDGTISEIGGGDFPFWLESLGSYMRFPEIFVRMFSA